MRATIDKVGRVVIPKPLRDQAGLRPGEVELILDGPGVRIEPVAGQTLEERDGVLVVPPVGERITDDDVRALRDAGRR